MMGRRAVLCVGFLLAGNSALAQPTARDYAHWQALYQALPAADQAALQRAAGTVAALPLAEQKTLRERFASLDRLHQQGWRLGPRVGRYWPQLQPLFGFVAETEREALRQLLWSLDEDDLRRLARLSSRTAPEQREEMRQTLLHLPASQRTAWLRQHAGV